MTLHRFKASVRVDAPPEAVFAWHERPGALQRLPPPWQSVKVVSRRGTIRDGDRATMRLRVAGMGVTWVAEHRDYDPPRGFRDVQMHGPFRKWEHTHRFEADDTGGCRVVDEITYELPGGALGQRLGEAYAEDSLERLMAWRHAVLKRDIAMHRDWAGHRRLEILVTGSSGLIGSALVPLLTTGGHRVLRLVRREPASADEVAWSPSRGELDDAALAGVAAGDGEAGVDAVVNLAGESIVGRWTDARKRRIRDSRLGATKTLTDAIARMQRRPVVMVNASGINAYGSRGDELLDEASDPGYGFLAETVQAWERAARAAEPAGVRVVMTRFGVVLSPAGGALGSMLPAFRLGLGGPLAGGAHWWSWVSIEDVVRAIYFCLVNDVMAGPVNVVAPQPVTNRDFTRTLGGALHRPTFLGVPGAALRLAMGQMAEETLLGSMRVLPRRLTEAGFDFVHPHLDQALAQLLGLE